MVILGFVNAFTCINKVRVLDKLEGNGTTQDLPQFKAYLMSSLLTRFTTRGTGAKTKTLSLVGDKFRYIVTVDIFHSEIYLLATALDPRIKLTPFEGSDDYTDELRSRIPSESSILSLLKRKLTLSGEKNYSGARHDTHAPHNCEPTPQKKPKYGSMFNLIKTINGKKNEEKSEIDAYLALPLEDELSTPLEFWKRNDSRFPKPAQLAQQCLAIPATSGSLERRFSIAGAIGRARRSRITTSLMEKNLTVREHYQQFRPVNNPDCLVVD